MKKITYITILMISSLILTACDKKNQTLVDTNQEVNVTDTNNTYTNQEVNVTDTNNTYINQEVNVTDNTEDFSNENMENNSLFPNNYQIVNSSEIAGLTIQCGEKEFINTFEEIHCNVFPMKVYLGNLYIGELQKSTIDNTIFIQDLLNIHRADLMSPKLSKISMILQTLDNDKDALNGIYISPNTVETSNLYFDINTNIEELELEELEYILQQIINESINKTRTIVKYQQAQTNIVERMSEQPPYSKQQREKYYGKYKYIAE